MKARGLLAAAIVLIAVATGMTMFTLGAAWATVIEVGGNQVGGHLGIGVGGKLGAGGQQEGPVTAAAAPVHIDAVLAHVEPKAAHHLQHANAGGYGNGP